jgi:hypothetical protein
MAQMISNFPIIGRLGEISAYRMGEPDKIIGVPGVNEGVQQVKYAGRGRYWWLDAKMGRRPACRQAGLLR